MRHLESWDVAVSAALTSAFLCFLATMPVSANANVSEVITETWTNTSEQIRSVVDNVVLPALALILVIAFFGKLALAYFDYRKHGMFEWAGPAILFACLIFVLLAPQYIWRILGL